MNSFKDCVKPCIIPNCPVCAYQLPSEVHEEIIYPAPLYRWSGDMLAVKRFGLFFAMQFVSYGLLAWNFRSLAKGYMWNMLISDGLIAAVGFSLISKVAEAKDHPARFGYIAGGMVGSGFAMVITKWIWHG